MTNLLANFAKVVDPAVTTVFNGDFKRAPEQSSKIVNKQTAEDYITEMASNANLSMAKLRTEEGQVNYQDFLPSDSKNLTQYVYDRGIKISKKLMKWQKLGQIKALVQGAAQSIVRRREFDITKLLERSFLTTYTHTVDGSTKVDLTGGDSLALITPSHASTRSSTAINNRIGDGTTVNMDLAEDALEAAETVTAAALTDQSDQVISVILTDLYVSRKNHWKAQRLLKSAGRVGTPNNDVNLVQNRYELVCLDYMESTYNEYFFMRDKELNRKPGFLTMLVGTELEHEGPFIDFDSKAIKHSWEIEMAAGHNNYHSFLASKGTNAA